MTATVATARDVLKMLRRHYLPDPARPGGIFAPEIQAPHPGRFADLIWQGCTAAAGPELQGHEIKVTRADLVHELTDPTKSDAWQRYCDRWWLVVPDPRLLDGLTLPASWGVLTPPSGRRTRSMTVHVPAPALRPAEQAPALRTLAAWLHWQVRDLRADNHGLERRASDLRDANRELRLRVPPDPSTRDVVARIVAQLGDGYGERVGEYGHEVSVDDVVVALRDLGESAHRRDEAVRELKSVRQGMQRLRGILDRAIEEDAADAQP